MNHLERCMGGFLVGGPKLQILFTASGIHPENLDMTVIQQKFVCKAFKEDCRKRGFSSGEYEYRGRVNVSIVSAYSPELSGTYPLRLYVRGKDTIFDNETVRCRHLSDMQFEELVKAINEYNRGQRTSDNDEE